MNANKSKAVQEVLHIDLQGPQANKFFISVFSFFLYNDCSGLFKILDFRSAISESDKPNEEYHFFKYMLKLLVERYPNKVSVLL